MPRKETSLNVLTIVIILAATIVILTEFGNFRIAQGQGNLTIGNLTLTPEQKDAICNPNNPLSKLTPVNTTESHICGIPKTWHPSNITTTETGTEAASPPPPPSAIPGLLMLEQPPSQPAQSESIQPSPAKSIASSAVPPKSIAPQIPPSG
jgi:hypothetical protein